MPENAAAINTARRLAIPQGILAGIFTGADVWADLQVADRPANKGKLIVAIGCSAGSGIRARSLPTKPAKR